jgi:protein gp37
MGEITGIGWTDHTFNPWWGCTEISEGCDNCYARDWAAFTKGMTWGPHAPRIRTSEHNWNELQRWNRRAIRDGVVRRVFCASMADVLDGEVPQQWRDDLWAAYRKTSNLILQLLTKRPENYERMVPDDILCNPLVWKGFSAETQKHYDLRRRPVRHLPGVRWVSYEPALGPLVLNDGDPEDWVVVGGESGPDAKRRPFEQKWAEDVRDQCRLMGVKFFMKQMSARKSHEAAALIPPLLQIKEFPA